MKIKSLILILCIAMAGMAAIAQEQHANYSRELNEKANAGDVDAMVQMGLAYYYGYGIDRHYPTAVKWFEQAAEAGNVPSMAILGSIYSSDKAVRADKKKSRMWYDKAAKAGNVDAMRALVSVALYDKDYDAAGYVAWLKDLANQGDAEAMYNLARYLERSANDKNCIEWYKKAVDKGHALSSYELALYYDLQGPEGEKQAQEWFEKTYNMCQGSSDKEEQAAAIDAVDHLATFNAGNPVAAAQWKLAGAQMGDPNSMISLAQCYYDGRGVEKNYDEAIKWLDQAYALTDDPHSDKHVLNSYACALLGDCYYKKKDYDTAWKYYNKHHGKNVMGESEKNMEKTRKKLKK